MEILTEEGAAVVYSAAKSIWDALVVESGLTEAMFIALNPKAIRFLVHYKQAQLSFAKAGVTLPDLGDRVIIRFEENPVLH